MINDYNDNNNFSHSSFECSRECRRERSEFDVGPGLIFIKTDYLATLQLPVYNRDCWTPMSEYYNLTNRDAILS